MREKNNIAPINEELNVVMYKVENIKNLIYIIRGKQVMLDSDVAMLYHYSTKRINETVRRNKDRFPENFCFQLTEKETENLRSQFATSSLEKENYRGRRYYIDDSILKMLPKKNKNVEVVILTSQNCNLTKLDIDKFNKQYPILKVAKTNEFHDFCRKNE